MKALSPTLFPDGNNAKVLLTVRQAFYQKYPCASRSLWTPLKRSPLYLWGSAVMPPLIIGAAEAANAESETAGAVTFVTLSRIPQLSIERKIRIYQIPTLCIFTYYLLKTLLFLHWFFCIHNHELTFELLRLWANSRKVRYMRLCGTVHLVACGHLKQTFVKITTQIRSTSVIQST